MYGRSDSDRQRQYGPDSGNRGKAGARVVYRAWTNDFSAQRNFGLSATDATWVLYLDADEHLTPELASAIRRATEPGAEPAAYRMLRLCCAFGKYSATA